MRVTVSVITPDGKELDRPPTEEECQQIARRYVKALLEMSLPGAKVTFKDEEK